MDWDRFSTALLTRRLDEQEPTLSTVLDAVTDDYTQYSLYWLVHNPNTTVMELADFVTGFEAMRTGQIATPADHERVRIHLYHSVLPKLDAIEYVSFDPDDRSIEPARRHGTVSASLGIDA